MRTAGLPLLLAPLAALACCALTVQAAQVELTSIDFAGNASFPDDSLSQAIFNHETRCRSFLLYPFCLLGAGFSIDDRNLNERELPGDILRLRSYYSRRGFKETQVDTVMIRPDEDHVSILFRIEEGRPVRVSTLEVIGLEELEDLRADGDLPIQEGDLLNSIDLDAARDTLIQRLQNRGYPHADVLRTSRIPAGTPYEARVTFDVDAGRRALFGPITLAGNQRLSDGVVLRMLPFEEGQEYSLARRLEGQRNLYSIEMVLHASIDEAADATGSLPDTILPLRVTVTEGSTHRVRGGVGWSSSDCLNTEGRWASRNFLGGARRLQLRARLSNMASEQLHDGPCWQSGVGDFGGLNWLVSADFTQPWILDQRFALGGSLFHERQSLKDVYVRQAVGIDLSVSRTLGPYTSLVFAYRPQLAQLEAAEVFFCTTFLVCTPEDVAALQDPNWLAPLAFNFARDRANSLLNPTRGYHLLFNAEHASSVTGSNFSYNRIVAGASRYFGTSQGHVLALRVQAGWVSAGTFSLLSGGADIVHPQKRFYAGGANSVRGFAQNQLGPRVLTADVSRLLSDAPDGGGPLCLPTEVIDLSCDANALPDADFGTPRPTGGRMLLEGGVEYRVPLGPRVEGAIFADFGRVWEEEAVGASRFEVAPGIGVRYVSPIGPVRIDVGYRFRGAEPLRVVTSQVRRFDPTQDELSDRITVNDATRTLDFVLVDELAVLAPAVEFGPGDGFSFGRLQLHLSIGQAF